jgi:WD40 repeat protein
VAALTAKVLEWSGLHLNPITKTEFRDKNVLAKYSGGLDVNFVRSHGPAEKAGINEVDIVVGLQGRSLATLKELDAAVQDAVDQVKRGDADALQWDMLRDGETIRINMPFPAGELALDESDAASAPDSDSHEALPKRLHRLITDEKVKLVACSPDGKLVAVATDQSTFPSAQIDWKRAALILDVHSRKMVKLQITTREEYSQLAANKATPRSEVTAIVFSPDGSQVAIGTSLGQVKLFDAQTGEAVSALDDEKARPADNEILRKLTAVKRALGSVSSLAFSPDGSLLATCGGSFEDVPFDEAEQGRLGPTGPGHVKVWEVKTGTIKHDLVGHSYAGAVAFSADGKLLASAGSWFGPQRGSGVIVWNPASGEKLRTIEQTTNGGVHSVVFGPETTLLAFAALEFDKDSERKSTKIILAHAGSGLTEWQQSIPRGAAVKGFSADSKSIAVLSGGRSIELFDTETGQAKYEIDLADSPETLRWADLSIAAKGNVLAIGGVGNDRKGSVEIWAVPTPELAPDTGARKNIDSSSKSGD